MSLYTLLEYVAAAGEVIFVIFMIGDIADSIKALVKKSKWTVTIENFKKRFPGVFYLAFMMAPTFYLTEYSLSEESNYSCFRLLYSIIALVLCVYSSYQDIKEHK